MQQSQTTHLPASAVDTNVIAQAVLAMALGLFIVGVVGFSHISAVHNADHDVRHANAFPCHSRQMPVFRSIVFSATLAGLIVGAVISVAQFFGTVPLIQKSEVYERKAAAEAPPAAHEQTAAPHDHGKERSQDSEWEPKDGFQRNAFT